MTKEIKQDTFPQESKKVYTREEKIKLLQDEIEVQELETKLQKLQAEFFVYRVQLIQATINLEGMTRIPDEKETAEMEAEFEKLKASGLVTEENSKK